VCRTIIRNLQTQILKLTLEINLLQIGLCLIIFIQNILLFEGYKYGECTNFDIVLGDFHVVFAQRLITKVHDYALIYAYLFIHLYNLIYLFRNLFDFVVGRTESDRTSFMNIVFVNAHA
jgi:hypothetical protein